METRRRSYRFHIPAQYPMGLGQSWDRREEGVKDVGIRPFGGKSIFKLPFSYLLPSEDTNEEH